MSIVTMQAASPAVNTSAADVRRASSAWHCYNGAHRLERELRQKDAGLRTHILVGVGAALFMLVSAWSPRRPEKT